MEFVPRSTTATLIAAGTVSVTSHPYVTSLALAVSHAIRTCRHFDMVRLLTRHSADASGGSDGIRSASSQAPPRRTLVVPIAALLVGAGVATGAYALIDDSDSPSQRLEGDRRRAPGSGSRPTSPARTRRRRRPASAAHAAASSRPASKCERRPPAPISRAPTRTAGVELRGSKASADGHALQHRSVRRAGASGPARPRDGAAHPERHHTSPRTWRPGPPAPQQAPRRSRRGACAFQLTLDSAVARLLHSFACAAGWSSQVARRAHNPKVAGSNPAPATSRSPC